MTRRVPVVRGGRLAAANRLDEIRAAGEELMRLETQAAAARRRVNQLVFDAYSIDSTLPSKMAAVLGVSRQRVWQIITKAQEKGAP